MVVEIRNREDKNIFLSYGDKNEFYNIYIKRFLEGHKNVQKITKEAFRNELEYILDILKEEVI